MEISNSELNKKRSVIELLLILFYFIENTIYEAAKIRNISVMPLAFLINHEGHKEHEVSPNINYFVKPCALCSFINSFPILSLLL
jgi:hypothetical protein